MSEIMDLKLRKMWNFKRYLCTFLCHCSSILLLSHFSLEPMFSEQQTNRTEPTFLGSTLGLIRYGVARKLVENIHRPHYYS